jgi:hypothetical protein
MDAMLFACGSKVRSDIPCAVFPRVARKTAHSLNGKYRSAEGSTRQLRKF